MRRCKFVIIADIAARTLGFAWLGVGAIVPIVFSVTGRRPARAGLTAQEDSR